MGDAADGARLDRRRADLAVGNPAEQLAEAFDLLVVEGFDRLGRDIAAGETCAAGGDDGIDIGIGDPGFDLGADLLDVVLDDRARGEGKPEAFV